MKLQLSKTNTLITALVITVSGMLNTAYGQTTLEEQKSLTPEAVLSDLLEGNKRFVQYKLSDPEIEKKIAITAGGQFPKAVILSCLDSRVPVEMVFDQGIGDVFVGRVAGNIENTYQLGSMEFATKLAGSKLVMVLGHSACGAVKGACDDAELGNLTNLLQNIKPAIDSVEGHDGAGRNSQNAAFVAAVVEQNVRQTVSDIRERSPVLAELEKEGTIMIVGALYDLESGTVTLVE